jgi:hypothetical protein
MKIAKVIAILVFGPLLGAAGGFVVGAIIVASRGGQGTPGDGILVMGCIAVSFVVSSCISLALAASLFDKRKDGQPNREHGSN